MDADSKTRPLPPIPEPPSFGPDERQDAFYREVSHLLESVGDCDDGLAVIGLTDWTGYPASSPDLGRIADLIYDAFHKWPADDLEQQWDASVAPWITHLASVWIQRVRRREVRLLPERVVELFLMTRDDRGDYSFHVRVNLAAVGSQREAA